MIKNGQTCDKRIRQFVAEEHFSEFNANSWNLLYENWERGKYKTAQ